LRANVEFRAIGGHAQAGPAAFGARYSEIAAELKVPYEDSVLRSVLLDNALKSDMVHPNAAGYARIAFPAMLYLATFFPAGRHGARQHRSA
jgi:lysophospholipase L1-like esterase